MSALPARLLSAVLCVASCSACVSADTPAVGRASCASRTHAFLEANRERYRQAIVRSRGWLDGLRVDPLELRRYGIKGKKKLAEQLAGYYRHWLIAEPKEKAQLLARIRDVAAITYESRYHDLATIDDEEFKEDSTSYLRTAVLMERLGLDTAIYREQIVKIHPRLDSHMARRGPFQRRGFHDYYRTFGLKEPFPLAGALQEGLIARRPDPTQLSTAELYQLTHEVFIPYEYGDRLDAEPFDPAARQYLRTALELHVARYIDERDPDLVAELVSSLRYLRLVEGPAYRDGLAYLFETQHADGSWGDLERARRAFGAHGRYGMILHTTLVAIDALTIAFHEPWNRDLFPGCEGRS